MDIVALRTAHPDHWRMATAIRALTLDAVTAANSGHSGMPIGMADVEVWAQRLKSRWRQLFGDEHDGFRHR